MRKAAVLGSPIAHSLSPVLHNAAYASLGLDAHYDKIEISQTQLADFVATLDDTWMGLSLTMPLKEVAFDVATTISATATLAGAINTLVLRDGIHADNTDVYGIVAAVREMTDSHLDSATVIGSGATARSALIALRDLGVSQVAMIARNPSAIAECSRLADQLGISLTPSTSVAQDLNAPDVVISTVPKGVADDFITVVKDPRGVLLDVVYHPWPTALAAAWQAQGSTATAGHVMLLHQAARQVELMTGQLAPVEVMRSALMEALGK